MLIFLLCWILLTGGWCGEFGVQFTTLHERNVATYIKIGGKQLIENVDLFASQLAVCCKPNRSIFQIIHNFLENPFFQINEFSCPENEQSSQEIIVPTIGVIKMNVEIRESPECRRGVLGLNKQSHFIDFLPINAKVFKILITKNQDSYLQKVSLFFGDDKDIPPSNWTFQSRHPHFWDITVQGIYVGDLELVRDANIVFSTDGEGIKIPSEEFDKLLNFFPTNQTCRLVGQELFCLCQSGIPTFFPQFSLHGKNEAIQIPAKAYMQIDSNICKLDLHRSPDSFWHFDLFLFEDQIFYFDRSRSQIVLEKFKSPVNLSSDTIHLPIQLILNCCVVLILCAFASMVIIQLIKRVSGLADARDENIREYVLRRNLD